MAERDIVQRLRQYANEEDWPISHMLAVLREAADEIARLRASTPEGSETEDRTMDGCDPARATYTRAISPSSHDVEALREALEKISKREHADTCSYVLEYEHEYACDCHVEIARRALSQHVGGEV